MGEPVERSQVKWRGKLPSWSGIPRMYRLVGFLLPREARMRYFEPSFEDLRQDYLLWLRSHRHGWQAKALMNLALQIWVLKLFYECFKGAFRNRG